MDLGLVSRAFAEQEDGTLRFGDLKPLVSMLQETPIERLQPVLADQLKSGVSLKNSRRPQRWPMREHLVVKTTLGFTPLWR